MKYFNTDREYVGIIFNYCGDLFKICSISGQNFNLLKLNDRYNREFIQISSEIVKRIDNYTYDLYLKKKKTYEIY